MPDPDLSGVRHCVCVSFLSVQYFGFDFQVRTAARRLCVNSQCSVFRFVRQAYTPGHLKIGEPCLRAAVYEPENRSSCCAPAPLRLPSESRSTRRPTGCGCAAAAQRPPGTPTSNRCTGDAVKAESILRQYGLLFHLTRAWCSGYSRELCTTDKLTRLHRAYLTRN